MEKYSPFTLRCWGARGSLPAPLVGQQVEDKQVRALLKYAANPVSFTNETEARDWLRRQLAFADRSTYGGNTTCYEVRCRNGLVILDMGSGLRELGRSLMPQTLRHRRLSGLILQSHVHWDHIQGFPFWSQLYLPRRVFNNEFLFCGGKAWDAQLESVLVGQMNPPVFPVSMGELQHTGMRMNFRTVFDGWSSDFNGGVIGGDSDARVSVLARKLNHPQETFGYRLTCGEQTLAFTTDHEPYADGVPAGLLELVRDADVWLTDCQYSHDTYVGADNGPQRHGWGHSFPEYLARVALVARPKLIMLTHFDPADDDDTITARAQHLEWLCGIPVRAAFEGMQLAIGSLPEDM